MRKLATGILITTALILIITFAFALYAQFALDYSLESLKQAIEASQEGGTAPGLSGNTYESSLEGLIVDELAQKEVNYETVVLLEHATRSIRDAVEQSGYARAGVYLAEVLKEKTAKRNWVLRTADAVYHSVYRFIKTLKEIWRYLLMRFKPAPKVEPLEGTSLLILGEAERMEKDGKLEEAEVYYREFLTRFADRPEVGFVTLSLAHALTKMKKLDDAEKLVRGVIKDFPGTREETLANGLLSRIDLIRRRLAHLPELENWIKSQPERLFEEAGGLGLALDYLATYQTDRALAILEKLEQAPDPRIRTKALFYQAWIHKWQGDTSKGKEILQLLLKEPQMEEKLSFAAGLELAEVHYERKEYREAVNLYENLSRKAVNETWKALSELEQGQIYLFNLGDAEAARQSLLRLEQILPQISPDYLTVRTRLEEAFQRGLRDEAFAALAQGRIETAFDILQAYLEKFPRDGLAHSALGSIYLLKGGLKEALEEAEKGYSFEQNEYTAAVLGYVYEKLGRLDEAGKYYAISVRIKPSYLTAQFNLAWTYSMTGRYEEADQVLSHLENLKPQPAALTRAKVLNNHACVLWALGKKEEAAGLFQEALRVMPGLVEAQRNLNLAAGERPISASLAIEAPLLKS